MSEPGGCAPTGVARPRPFWQARYYDFNVWGEGKFVEKLRYIHRNPVARGLVARPADWARSSFRHYVGGDSGVVEIESQWTARIRERAGIFPTLRVRPPAEKPRPTELGRATLKSGARRDRWDHPLCRRKRDKDGAPTMRLSSKGWELSYPPPHLGISRTYVT